MAILFMGGSMALTQYLLAVNGLWNLAGFVAGMVGLVFGAAVTRLSVYYSQSSVAGRRVQRGRRLSPCAYGWRFCPIWP